MKNAVLFVLTIVTALTITAQTTTEALQYSPGGELTAPKDYRQWIYLSSGLGMTYGPAAQADAANPKFDNVFVNPTSWRAFNETGQWPERRLLSLRFGRLPATVPSITADSIRTSSSASRSR